MEKRINEIDTISVAPSHETVTKRLPTEGSLAGLRFSRLFTEEGVHPFDQVEWTFRNSSIHDEKGEVIPAAVGSYLDPTAFPHAHAMWRWCKDRGLNIRDLAMQFAMHAPVQGIGVVLTGAANPTELDEVYVSATTPVPEDVWQEFEANFGLRT